MSVVVCGFSLVQRRLEPAGHAFHAAHEKPLLEVRRRGKDAPTKVTGEGSDDDAEAPGDASWRKKRKEGGTKSSALKLSPALTGVDLYALLEVTENASAEQIKKQYRKLVLQHHPDKYKNEGDTSAAAGDVADDPSKKGVSEKDMVFIKIQEAYEVMSDPAKRRQYDSSLDFDDNMPDEVDGNLGFYGTFGPAFQRNARWSCRHPVPELGTETTDIAKVHKFYDFWFNFESWRDFSMHDEFNLEEAEFREERRWMERQNQKVRKKYQDGERRRILRLAETAERWDPRIRAEREEREAKKREEKERRARLKQEEDAAKRREEEERRQREECERADQEEKERLEREQRKEVKQAAKSLRQRAKKSVQSRCKLSEPEMEELQELCLSLDTEPLEALCKRLEALPSSRQQAEAIVREELKQWRARQSGEQEEQAKQREEARLREKQKTSEPKDAVTTAWAAEEMGLLAKGLQKFPGGLGGRWALIAQFLTQTGFPRTEKEVIEKTKEMSDGQSLRSMGAQVAADLTSLKTPKAKASAAVPAAAPPVAAGEATKAPGAAASGAKSSAVGAEAGGKAAVAESEWSAEQQRALEAALQKHPASVDKNERWRLIAEDVPGKTKAQCVDRFKFLRDQLTKQRK